ncbi:MAG: hypothetical protein LBQ61_02270 [Spirochaetales bacterium]|jgi:uncharacterized iron-regulated membrane protein|nr:hypothetical protein [Spirochaetales bacterium]
MTKKMEKLLVVAAVLFILSAGGLAAQQYEITDVQHLGDFETDAPRDRAISETVDRLQRQNPNRTYRWIRPPSGDEALLVAKAWEAIPESANVDSTYAVYITSSRYIIFIQCLPFANNPYYYWIYRGDER